MGQNSNLPNVALVSLEVIVNTGDLRQTVDELTERCVTHPTTVDVMATPKFVSDFSYALYKSMGLDTENLPSYMVTALEMSATDHLNMMTAVQPYIDSAISKTVNVPGDYPFEEFKNLYLDAWHAGLKGLATYRPNDILGAVLVANDEKKEAPKKEEAEPIKESVDYMRTPIDKRPHGALPAVVEKIQFMAGGQLYRYYLTVGFLPLGEGDEKVLRPIEFFLKSIEGDNDTHWIEAAMRGLSLSARAGELDRALRDMKKVRWTNGPIRFGETLHADGYNVPKFHTSPVAVLAYAIEQHIQNKAVPANLAEKQKGADPEQKAPANMVEAGRECHECGAHAVVRRDGCEKCTNCGMLGSCG